jgi:hypothetical protein
MMPWLYMREKGAIGRKIDREEGREREGREGEREG